MTSDAVTCMFGAAETSAAVTSSAMTSAAVTSTLGAAVTYILLAAVTSMLGAALTFILLAAVTGAPEGFRPKKSGHSLI